MRLSTIRSNRPSLPGRFLVFVSDRGRVDTWATVWLEGLGCGVVVEKNTIALNSDAQSLLAVRVLQLQLITG
jgi:hypothetical protein